MLDISEYLYAIKDCRYALSKIDVPYMPKNFPNEYPVGKDMDMYVHQEDYLKVIDTTESYINKYDKYKMVVINVTDNYRIRLQNGRKLHYQIDIKSNSKYIIGRILVKNYYVLSFENEKIVRRFEVENNPQKLHHMEWLKKYEE